MTDIERAELRERLSGAKGRLDKLNSYIAGMEDTLQRGTTWECDPEASRKMCTEIEEIARKDREESEKREIARYGRALTDKERRGWVWPLPTCLKSRGKD